MPQMIDAGVDASTELQPPAAGAGFQIHSPEIDVAPGQDITFCYYLHLPNTADLEIKSWESELTAGVQGVVLYTTTSDRKPPNTLSADPCGYLTTNAGPVWAYQAQPAVGAVFPVRGATFAFPPDDGNGQPVGFPVHANQSAYLQIHLQNPGTTMITSQVKINGNAYPEGKQVTEAGPFTTYSSTINIGPGTPTAKATGMVTASCRLGGTTPVPANAKFFSISMHTFRHGTHMSINDTPAAGVAVNQFDGTNWHNPNEGSQILPDKPATFHTFAGKYTYLCQYENTESAAIKSGDDAARDEICLSVGYFFPSPGGTGGFCADGLNYMP